MVASKKTESSDSSDESDSDSEDEEEVWCFILLCLVPIFSFYRSFIFILLIVGYGDFVAPFLSLLFSC